MKLNNLQGSLLIVFAMGLFVFWGMNSQAEEKLPEAQSGIEVATVDIFEPSLRPGENGDLKISFDLFNKKGVQLGVKYGVEMRQSGKQETFGRKIFPETLNLVEGMAVRKELSYLAPNFLRGEYELWIVAQNERGLILASALAGKKEFQGSGSYVELSQCNLKFPDGNLVKGSGVAPGSNLTVDCVANNLSEGEVTFTPQFQTYLRSPFGKLISEGQADSLTLAKGEKKNLEINIPVADSAQIHSVVLRLADGKNGALSNVAEVYYKVEGAGTMINNVVLSSENPKKEAMIQISMFWAKKKDAKVFAEVSLESDGQKCSNFLRTDLSAKDWGIEEIMEVADIDCPNGEGLIKLVDENGKALDEFVFSLKKDKEKGDKNVPPVVSQAVQELPQSKFPVVPFAIGAVALIIGIAAIVLWRRKETGPAGIALLFLLMTSLFGWNAKEANATVCNVGICVTNQLYRAAVTPGTTFGVSNVATSNFCLNDNMGFNAIVSHYPSGAHYFNVARSEVQINGQTVFNSMNDVGFNNYEHIVYATGNYHIPGPSGLGSYSARFYGGADYSEAPGGDAIIQNVGYTVNDCTPLQGECGPAAGKSYTTRADAEAAGLCSVGTLKVTSFVGTATGFTWRCDGANGGPISPVCSASRTPLTASIYFGNDATKGTVTSRNVVVGGSFQIKSIATGATVCRVITQKDNSGTWTNIASPNWTTTAATENLPQVPVTETTKVVNSAGLSAGNYRYGIRCFNTEAGTYIPWKFLTVNYGSAAICTGTGCDTNVSKNCGNESPSSSIPWAYVNSCTGPCQCECNGCLSGTNCIPDTLSNFRWQEFPGVDCTGKCGLTYGVEPACVANSSCGGTVTAPNGCDPATKPATPSENCPCDDANWREVEP